MIKFVKKLFIVLGIGILLYTLLIITYRLIREYEISCDYHCEPYKVINNRCYCKVGCGWWKIRWDKSIPEC